MCRNRQLPLPHIVEIEGSISRRSAINDRRPSRIVSLYTARGLSTKYLHLYGLAALRLRPQIADADDALREVEFGRKTLTVYATPCAASMAPYKVCAHVSVRCRRCSLYAVGSARIGDGSDSGASAGAVLRAKLLNTSNTTKSMEIHGRNVSLQMYAKHSRLGLYIALK